jgi:hypothetical protein
MESICQACGYQRKPTDQAPDWQCPSCGKAYAKTSHDSGGSLSGYAPSASYESVGRLDEAPAYQRKPSDAAFTGTGGVNKKHGWIFAGVLAILFTVGIPILGNPSSASTVLLHGEAGFLCVSLLVLFGLAAVGRHLSAGVDVNDPRARFALLAKFFALTFTVIFVVIAIWLRNQEHIEVKIQLNGQRAMADVVRIYTGSCGKRSCSIDVEYAYTPANEVDGASQPLHGYAQLGTSSRPNDPDIIYARTNRRVPIAYEVDRPEVSALNFNDDVFRLDHGKRYLSTVTLLGKIFLGALLALLAVAGFIFWAASGKQPSPG